MTTPDLLHSPQSVKGLLTQLTLAGTAALAGSSARAQIIVTSVNENIGFAPGDLRSFTSSLPGNGQFGIGRTEFQWSPSHSSWYVRTLVAGSTNSINPGFGHGALFKTGGNLADVLPSGKVWSTIGGGTNNFGLLNVNDNVPGGIGAPTVPTYANQYLAFRFPDPIISGQYDYGWVELSLTDNSYADMTVQIDAYAYSTSGIPIPTGDLGTSVPEPSAAMALAALSALTLGAVGVRRMKALKVAA
jgi:hypothetical protein